MLLPKLKTKNQNHKKCNLFVADDYKISRILTGNEMSVLLEGGGRGLLKDNVEIGAELYRIDRNLDTKL